METVYTKEILTRAESHSCVFIHLCDIHDVAQEIGKRNKKLLTPWLIF